MRDSVSVFTSCSPRMAVSRTGSQYGVSMQWAAVTWDKAGYAMNLWTVTVTSHWEFSSAAPQLGLREPFLLRPTIQGYSLTSTLWPPTTRCLLFVFPQTIKTIQSKAKLMTRYLLHCLMLIGSLKVFVVAIFVVRIVFVALFVIVRIVVLAVPDVWIRKFFKKALEDFMFLSPA